MTSRGAAPAVDHAAAWQAREGELAAALAEPVLPALTRPWRGLFAGIGGGGIVTCSAVVAMAAHIEGRQVSTLDFTGLAQKNGAVVSHVQVAETGLDVVRIPLGEADLLLGADLAVSADPDVLGRCAPGAAVVGNLDLQAGATFLHDRDVRVDAGLHRRAIERHTERTRSLYLRGSLVAERLFGTAQAVNTLLLGIAWQRGLLPLGRASLLRAIKLNGTAVAMNERAFLWGRLLASQPGLIDQVLAGTQPLPDDLGSVVGRRAAELVRYGGKRLARRYRGLVDAVRAAGDERLSRAVAEGAFRAYAIKDEYEVARLHAEAEYGAAPVFHMAPPLISRIDPATGRRRKIAVPGRIALPLFRALRHGKALRGTPLDVFGWQAERRAERAFARQYESDGRAMLPRLRPGTMEAAVALASLPMAVRGFGPVKAASMADAAPQRAALLAEIERSEVRAAA